MRSSTSSSESDARALRRWRVAFVIAIVLAPLWAAAVLRWRWALITLGGESGTFAWSDLLSAKGMAIIAVLPGAVAVGWLGCRLQRGWSVRAVDLASLGLALVMVAGAETAIRIPSVQSAFLLGVNARLDRGAWAAREPILFQLDVLAPDPPEVAAAGVTLIGSSQAVIGFDHVRLQERLGRPVYRRAVAGMFPLEMCSAQERLVIPPAGTAVLYLSPFDIAARDTLYKAWMRAMITPHGWADLRRALGPELVARHGKSIIELGWASRVRLWALREYARRVLFHPVRREPPPEASDGGGVGPAVSELVIDPVYVEASLRGLDFALDRLRDAGMELLVLEGEVNPVFREEFPDAFWADTTARIRDLVERHGARYLALEDYAADIRDDEWRDNTHVDERGRIKLTEALARQLNAASGVSE